MDFEIVTVPKINWMVMMAKAEECERILNMMEWLATDLSKPMTKLEVSEFVAESRERILAKS